MFRETASQNAAEWLHQHSLFARSTRIACYYAQADELSCAPIIQHIWAANKKCFLPVLSFEQEKLLDFGHYGPDTHLALNRYGIPEPSLSEKTDLFELDLILLPLVGFDLEGNRLGMGGGYYDYTLGQLQGNSVKRPFLLGVGFDFQQIGALPVDLWDVKLDGVLTESGVQVFIPL